jgi:S-adenosylmethionine-dependent methyltransferase
MLERAEAALAPYAENSRIVLGRAEDSRYLFGSGSFDVVLLHAVICYVEDPESILSSVAAVLKEGGTLSVVFKNRDALPFRHAAQGRVREAVRVLEDPFDAGNLGIVNRARTRGEVEEALARIGFDVRRAYGVRVFADLISEELEEEDAVEALVTLELRAARLEPY